MLALEDVPEPAPGPGQALVRHRAIGVNFIDTYHRTGLYPLSLPSGLGMEAVGTVEATGEGVTEVTIGQRVGYAAGPPGAYADARVLPADRLVPIPEAISDDQAAAILLKGMTAHALIHGPARVQPGDTVLYHAAVGGVGLIATQWLAALGVTVIGTVGSDEKAELARAHGCAHTIVYTRENFVERVRALTDGRGVSVVFDAVGKSTFAGSLDSLARRGHLILFGNASGKPDPIDPAVLGTKGSLSLTRLVLFDYTHTRQDLLAAAAAVFAAVQRGAVRVHVGQEFPLAEAAAAHAELERRTTTGSTVLRP